MYRSNIKVPKPSPLLSQAVQLPTLFVEHESRIELNPANPNELLIHHQQKTCGFSLAQGIRNIVAFGRVDLEGWALMLLLEKQTPIIFFDVNGEFLGRLEPQWTIRPDLIKAQALMTDEQRLHLMQMQIWETLRKYRRYLQRQVRDRNIDLNQEIEELKWSIDAVFKSQDVAGAIGLLGRGTRIYYPALAQLVPGWDYTGRKVNQPLNLMLNFTYSLLKASAQSAIAAVGLDSRIGIWHTSDRTDGLADDLICEFKQAADAIVIRAINRGQIALKDFDGWDDSKRLPPRVVRILVHEYERKMNERFKYPFLEFETTYQEAIHIQALQIGLYLSGQIAEYFPLTLK